MNWNRRQTERRVTKADGRIADMVRGHRDAAKGITECPFPAGTDASKAWLNGQRHYRISAGDTEVEL